MNLKSLRLREDESFLKIWVLFSTVLNLRLLQKIKNIDKKVVANQHKCNLQFKQIIKKISIFLLFKIDVLHCSFIFVYLDFISLFFFFRFLGYRWAGNIQQYAPFLLFPSPCLYNGEYNIECDDISFYICHKIIY